MRTTLGCLGIVVLLGIVFSAGPAWGACSDEDVDCWIGVLEKGALPAAMKAAMALGTIGDPRAVEPLVKKLGHKDMYMATAASYALTKIGDPAVPSLVEAGNHKNAQVRKLAAHALGQIGAQAYDVLSRLSRDTDPAVRLRALRALRTLKDKRAVADGILSMKDQHRGNRIEAIRLLGTLEDPRCIQQLVGYGMVDLSAEVSMETAVLLIRFGSPSVDPLILAFDKQADFVKTRTLYVLGEIARKSSEPKAAAAKAFIFNVVDKPAFSVVVKQAAVTKAADISDPAAIPILQRLLKRIEGKPQYEQLVQVTVRALEKLNRP